MFTGAFRVVFLALALIIFGTETNAATPVLLIDANTSNVSFQDFDATPLKLFDFNADGKKELIAHNDNRYVYIIDTENGAVLSQVKPSYPDFWEARPLNGVEVSLLDGQPALVVANSAAIVSVYKYNPAMSTEKKFVFEKRWERRLDDCHSNPGMDAKPVIADLDKDGRYEILAQTEESGIYVLKDNGQTMWKKCIGGVTSDSFAMAGFLLDRPSYPPGNFEELRDKHGVTYAVLQQTLPYYEEKTFSNWCHTYHVYDLRRPA